MPRTGTRRSRSKDPAPLAEVCPTLKLVAHAPGNNGPSAEKFLTEIVERALADTNANGAAIALEAEGRVICCARAGESAPPVGAELDLEAGISGLCLRRGEVVRCDEASTDLRVDREAAASLGIASILAVPLKVNGTVVGLLEVFSKSPYAFGIPEETSVAEAAQQLMALIEGDPEREEKEEKRESWESILDMVSEPVANEVAVDAAPTSAVEPVANTPAEAAADTQIAETPAESIAGTPAAETPAEAVADSPLSKTQDPGDGKTNPTIEFSFADSLTRPEPKRRLLLPIAGLAVIAGAAIVLSVHPGSSQAKGPTSSKLSQPEVNTAPPLEALRVAAQQGDASAQLALAKKYRDGDGVERDDVEAASWLQQAARLGNADAQYELGNAYADGRGVDRDPINAYACYVLAGANNNSASDEALRLLTPKLSDAQIAQVRSTIGEMYLQGRGTPVDYAAAYTWFKLAESAGSADGQRLRQQVASKMTTQQIAAADRRAAEWLKRHSPPAR